MIFILCIATERAIIFVEWCCLLKFEKAVYQQPDAFVFLWMSSWNIAHKWQKYWEFLFHTTVCCCTWSTSSLKRNTLHWIITSSSSSSAAASYHCEHHHHRLHNRCCHCHQHYQYHYHQHHQHYLNCYQYFDIVGSSSSCGSCNSGINNSGSRWSSGRVCYCLWYHYYYLRHQRHCHWC